MIKKELGQLVQLNEIRFYADDSQEYMVFEENGADINDVDAYGRTALHIARYKCNFKIEELLMSYNPDLSIEDEWRTKAMEIGIA